MILGLLQARMSSKRLPGKVMQPILGKPMILHQIDRIRRARLIDKLVVVTSSDDTDEALAGACLDYSVPVYRGSLEDVLDRFYQAALLEGPDHIVRLTGDCPLADPKIIDRVCQFHLDGEFDYASNVHPPTWPDGLDVEIFRNEKLIAAWRQARDRADREHVTPWILRQPGFTLGNLTNQTDFSALRWTVDEPEDLEFARRIFEGIYREDQNFGVDEILNFVGNNPELQEINQNFARNAGSA